VTDEVAGEEAASEAAAVDEQAVEAEVAPTPGDDTDDTDDTADASVEDSTDEDAAVSAEDTSVETPDDEAPAAAEASADQEPAAQAEAEPAPEAAPARRGRRRASRPTAAFSAAGEPTLVSTGDEATSTASADDTAADEPARPPVTLTFQAPEPVAEPRRRSRRSAAAAAPEAAPDSTGEDKAESVGEGDGRSDAEPTDQQTEDAGDGDDTASRRRRRGRRGRGRSRTAEGADATDEPADGQVDADAEPAEDTAPAESSAEESAAAGEADGEGGSSRRRRRRRRRGSGEDGDDSDREPRSRDDDAVRGVAGSTRLEAKRQRRREGRDQGRRRPPVVTEAEFLARRESVERVMVVRNVGERTQIAVLEDGVLVEHYVTRASSTSYAGNVYLGRVQNVLPSMEAAFIDIGKGRNAVLYAGEVNYDVSGLEGKPRKIEQALKSGQSVVVQVTKDPVGHKGARLTSQISLPGRFMVYVPDGGSAGISRKLPDTERARLKAILKRVTPEDAGVIIRTAAEGASEEELGADVQRLQAEWEAVQRKAAKATPPSLLHSEPDLVIRVVRDIFNEDFTTLVVQGTQEWDRIESYLQDVAPDLMTRLVKHIGDEDVFAAYRVEEQLLKGLDRKVYLPSGGSLVIDRTEAMTVVDVNTGKFTGKGGNLEETVTRNNLEAAEEIVRQLRLRDIGGIIVIDFIDMVLESNRELVLRRLTECLGRDRTRHQVAEVTSLGLVQMTRKRVGQGLLEAYSEPCPTCGGRGVIVHLDGPNAHKPVPRPVPRPPGAAGGNGAAENGGTENGAAEHGAEDDGTEVAEVSVTADAAALAEPGADGQAQPDGSAELLPDAAGGEAVEAVADADEDRTGTVESTETAERAEADEGSVDADDVIPMGADGPATLTSAVDGDEISVPRRRRRAARSSVSSGEPAGE
jgi:ribonuclease E